MCDYVGVRYHAHIDKRICSIMQAIMRCSNNLPRSSVAVRCNNVYRSFDRLSLILLLYSLGWSTHFIAAQEASKFTTN